MKIYKGYPYKIINNKAVLFRNIPDYIVGIASPSLCYLYSDEVTKLYIQSNSKEHIEKIAEVYSCNIKKNIKCKKRNCSKECCNKTTQYKYAKKTPINYIKKIINKIRGKYKYE